jgi:hypothetical protein
MQPALSASMLVVVRTQAVLSRVRSDFKLPAGSGILHGCIVVDGIESGPVSNVRSGLQCGSSI